MTDPSSLLEIERLRTPTDARAGSRRAAVAGAAATTVVSGTPALAVAPGAAACEVPNDRARGATA